MRRVKIILFVITFFPWMIIKAQFFDLTSIIIDTVRTTGTPLTLISDTNGNNGRLPFLASHELVTIFNLRDTVIDGLQINFFISKNDMVKSYKLRRDNKRLKIGSVYLNNVTKNNITVKLAFGTFTCNKGLSKKAILAIEYVGYYLVNYTNDNLTKGDITVKEITW